MPAKAEKYRLASSSHARLPLSGTRGGLSAAGAGLPREARSSPRGGPGGSLGRYSCEISPVPAASLESFHRKHSLWAVRTSSLKITLTVWRVPVLVQASRAERLECVCVCVHTFNPILESKCAFCLQCHGLSIDGYVLPSSTTREVGRKTSPP